MKINLEKIKKSLGEGLLSIEGDSPEKYPQFLTNDSRHAGPDTVFVAITGTLLDGHKYIEPAINSGCKVIVCERIPQNKDGVLFFKVKDSYSAYAFLAELYSNFPSKKLTLAGVTGTNGKTTTAYLISSILNRVSRCGMVSTIQYATGKKEVSASRTTPDAVELQKLYSEMSSSGCEYGVMEVSSHSLVQNRIGAAKFAVAVFTNLSGDHLDYHKDMESYFFAKKILFERHIAENGFALINIDDPYGKLLYESISDEINAISFGMSENADFRIENLISKLGQTQFELKSSNYIITLKSPLCGKFNAYNVAASALTAKCLGVANKNIIKGVAEMNSVPGRMERCSDNPVVFVDYAHTDDALENVLSTLVDLLNDRKLTVVFGCGGDRDKSKRPRMGAVVAKFADKIIITNDNPRTEEPIVIINAIIAGIPENVKYEVITERENAIRYAINQASDADVVLIAGKGHENYQEIDGVKFPFDDREVVRKIIVNGSFP